MGDLTANLSVHEFACDCSYGSCRSKLAAHMPLVNAIQECADHFKDKYEAERVMIDITDGNRCQSNNIDIQMEWAGKTLEQAKASDSKHMYHIAADFKLKVMICGSWVEVKPADIYSYLNAKYPNSCGLGLYDNRVHFDMRAIGGRW